jgi:hypothetical protein
MPTFIDESGDTGQNPDPANCHFRLAAVWVPSHDVAEAFRASVRQVRKVMGLREDYEFKFSKTWSYPDRREAFFQAAMQHEFRFAATSIDKRHEDWRDASSHAYHWATTTHLASSLRQTYLEAHRAMVAAGHGDRLDELVVVDNNGDKRFLAMVRETFRGLGSACVPPVFLIGKVRFRGSGPDELIQLVDMVCGAFGAHQDGDSTWYEMIERRNVGSRQEC